MIRLIMHGCNGKMGQVISKLVATEAELTIVAGIDKNAVKLNEYPVFESLDLCNIKADVVIDFSSPMTTETLLKYCIETQTPCVLCKIGRAHV